MDSRDHCIQLSGSDAGKKRPVSDDDGRMSSELYLAVCQGRKEEAMALLLHQCFFMLLIWPTKRKLLINRRCFIGNIRSPFVDVFKSNLTTLLYNAVMTKDTP